MWGEASASPVPSLERLSAEARELGKEKLGVCGWGKGSVLFSQERGREGSSLGLDMADKAFWEWEALTEVRKGTGRRLGEAGGRSRC